MKPAYRICRQRVTRAGIATELIQYDGVGITLHADSPDEAVAKARRLLPWLPSQIVAIPESN